MEFVINHDDAHHLLSESQDDAPPSFFKDEEFVLSPNHLDGGNSPPSKKNEKKYKIFIVVITDVETAKYNRRRYIEVRGLFCIPKDVKVEYVIDLAVEALKQYAEEKGYDKSFVENFHPVDFEYIVGVEDIKEVDKCLSAFDFEIEDKKYNRKGGYVERVIFPELWYEMDKSDIRKIVHSQVSPFFMHGRGKVGDWEGKSVVDEDFNEVK